MEHTLHDDVLGQLRFDGGFWTGHFHSTTWGRMELRVDPGRAFRLGGQLEAPTREQQRAFAAFRDAEQAVHDRAEEALFHYYAPMREQLQSPMFADCEPAPPFQEPEEVWRLVKDPGVVIPIQEGDPTVILEWLSPYDWDGVQVVFKNNFVKSVGPVQDLPFG